MSVRGSAVNMNHNPTLYSYRDVSPGHILESTKGIEMDIGL